jgi:hypothetical protein
MAENLKIECPCCQAKLEIHVASATVIDFQEAAKKPLIEDFAQAANKLKEQAAQRENLFQKSISAHKAKTAAADDLFDQLLKKAKEKPDDAPPKRAFDLD